MKFQFSCITEDSSCAIDDAEIKLNKTYQLIKRKNLKLADYLWNKRSINYETMWEIALAGLKRNVVWTDVAGKDHSDGTEVKTGTFAYVVNGNSYSYCVTIGNINTKTGNLKIVLYNPRAGCHYFVFIPKEDVSYVLSTETNRGVMRFSLPQPGKNPTGRWVNYVTDFDNFIKL